MWSVHAVLAFVFVFVAAWTTAAAHRWRTAGPGPAGVLVGAGFLIDQAWLGLHPFYRRRLASAFAVRRASMPDGGVGALAYQIEDRPPSAVRPAAQGLPAGHLRGRRRPLGPVADPPGRRAVSFTLSGDYVGGPDIGWVRTSFLEELQARPAAGRDRQAAMAVSGAAIASAMGRHAAAVQRLALSNVRLGTWLPNPAFLAALGRRTPSWRTPRLPRPAGCPTSCARSSAPTRPRAACCSAPTAATGEPRPGRAAAPPLPDRLLPGRQRRRRRSPPPWPGDHPGLRGAGRADHPAATRGLVPGSAPAGAVGGAGAAQRPPVPGGGGPRGIEYPEPFAVDGGELSDTGTLIVAKAVLTPDMPYGCSPTPSRRPFPRQSTGDQFFDHEQFDAYQALGHFIGTAALAEAPRSRRTSRPSRRRSRPLAPPPAER